MLSGITNHEFKAISDSLLALYEIQDLEQLKMDFMKEIGILIPFKQGCFYTMHPETGEAMREQAAFINTPDAFHSVFFESINEEDNYLINRFAYSHSNVFSESDIFNDKEYRETAFFKRFMAPQKLFYSCGIILIKNSKMLGLINLFRGNSWGDFNDKEKYIMEIFKDHMANMLERCFSEKRSIPKIDDDLLTDREKEVALLLYKGCSNEEIAETLCITMSTTKKHIYNIFQKYDVSNRISFIRSLHRK